jgi:predicted ATP-grasp superfamily ATP-dependent carboligase
MRSLGRLGIQVRGVNGSSRVPALTSRYCREKFIWDVDRAAAEESVEFLLQLGRKIGRRSILIPTSKDDAAIFVAEHAAALREWFIFPNQSPQLARALANKQQMYLLARKLGIPTPETVFPQSRNEVLRFLENAVFPIMLKGIDGMRLKQRTRKKMVIVQDQRALLEQYEALEDPDAPNLMLQEYIPGGEDTIWMFNGYFNESSECLVAFTGKKIRQTPVYTGSTSLGICLANPAVEQTTKDFMKAVGYKGILDIGYRYDARDGQYKVLDVNPRIGDTFRLFVAENGMDVARALYLDLTGQPMPPAVPRLGRRWMVEDADLASSRRYRRDGKLTIKEWARSLRGVEETAFFAWDDPLPFLTLCLNDAAELLSRVGGRQRRPPVSGKRPSPVLVHSSALEARAGEPGISSPGERETASRCLRGA